MFKLFGKKATNNTGLVKVTPESLGVKSEVPMYVLGKDESMFKVAGVEHSSLICRAKLGNGAFAKLGGGDQVESNVGLILSPKALKLPVNQLQVLVTYAESLSLDSEEIAFAETNTELWDGIYNSKSDKIKMGLVATQGRVAKKAFLKQEKSVISVPRKAMKEARNFEYFVDNDPIEDPIDLASGVVTPMNDSGTVPVSSKEPNCFEVFKSNNQKPTPNPAQ